MPAVAVDAASAPVAQPLGYYGKLPARGDFLQRRLPRDFVDSWDQWLQRMVLASREALGADWLDLYLSAPLWRVALPPGACAADAFAGVLMPSVDSVGRYFPLTLGRMVPRAEPCAGFVAANAPWFDSVEALALATLADGFDPAQLDDPVASQPGTQPPASGAAALPGSRVAPGSDGGPDPAALGALAQGRTLWWTTGSDRVQPSVLVGAALPDPAAGTALLDGAWSAHGWSEAAAAIAADPAPPPEDRLPPEDPADAWDRS